MEIKIKKLNEKAMLPSGGSAKAAGYDLYACLEEDTLVIAPHTTALVGTGLAAAIPEGYFGGIFARSGLASKQGLRPANCVGVVDSDYRGEIMVSLFNHSGEAYTISPGERMAQMVIAPVLTPEVQEADELEDTVRGAGCFGSTGRK